MEFSSVVRDLTNDQLEESLGEGAAEVVGVAFLGERDRTAFFMQISEAEAQTIEHQQLLDVYVQVSELQRAVRSITALPGEPTQDIAEEVAGHIAQQIQQLLEEHRAGNLKTSEKEAR